MSPHRTTEEKALLAFQDRVRALFGSDSPLDYMAEPWISGLTVNLVYDKGRLSHATAADPSGTIRDITANIKTILTVPLVLTSGRGGGPVPEQLEAGGVVYLDNEALADVNAHRVEASRSPYGDVRDAAAEALFNRDPKATAKTPLSMFCCEILRVEGAGPATLYEAMLQGQALGLRVNRPHLRVLPDLPGVLRYMSELRDKADTFPYRVQGIVVRVNRMAAHKNPDPGENEGPRSMALPF